MSSTSDWYKSLSADQQVAAQIPLSEANVTVKKRSHPGSPLSSSPVTKPISMVKLVAKKPKTTANVTKDVNREMKELFAQGKLTADAVLQCNHISVGEYLIQKWLQSQKLVAASEKE